MAVDLPSLTTPRLLLRPFESADGSDVERLAGAWEIADTTLNIPHPRGELGYWIAVAERGHGYATEAARDGRLRI